MTPQELENLAKQYNKRFFSERLANYNNLVELLDQSLLVVENRMKKDYGKMSREQLQRMKSDIKDEIASLDRAFQKSFVGIVSGNADIGIDYVTDFLKIENQSGFVSSFSNLIDEVTNEVYNRTYNDSGVVLTDRIKGISLEELRIINKELTIGIRSGLSYSEMISNIEKATESLSDYRITRIVNTESRIAFHSGESKSAEKWNSQTSDDFKIYFEWRVSPRHRVTDICDEWNGKFYEAGNLPQSHPFCMCFTLPVMKSIKDFEVSTP